MRGRFRLRSMAALVFSCASVASCSLLVPIDDDLLGNAADTSVEVASDGTTGGGQDGSLDGPTDASVDAAADGDGGIVYRWDFASGCGNWIPGADTIVSTETTLTRSAPGACRACPTSGQAVVQLAYFGVPPGFAAVAGVPVQLEAFARTVAGSLSFRVNIYTGTTSQVAFGTATTSYASAASAGLMTSDSTLFLDGQTSGCLIFDDITLRQ